MAYELIMNARSQHPISIQLIIVSREKTSSTRHLPHPPKTHESREVQLRGLGVSTHGIQFHHLRKVDHSEVRLHKLLGAADGRRIWNGMQLSFGNRKEYLREWDGLVRGGCGARVQQLGVLGGRLALLAIVALRMILRLICGCGFSSLWFVYSESEPVSK
jgi:hypothetical protein